MNSKLSQADLDERLAKARQIADATRRAEAASVDGTVQALDDGTGQNSGFGQTWEPLDPDHPQIPPEPEKPPEPKPSIADLGREDQNVREPVKPRIYWLGWFSAFWR